MLAHWNAKAREIVGYGEHVNDLQPQIANIRKRNYR
jgi:hypothetical protein